MAASVLLLEITDPEVNALLWRLRGAVSGRRGQAAVHMTVRGPYANGADPEALERARSVMAKDVLQIHGYGRFSNPDGEVVFLRVDSPNLKKVWWKRDFEGFTPHISIYRGTDGRLADVVEAFLKQAKVSIYCAEFRFAWHQLGQRNLFDRNEPTISAMNLLAEQGRLDIELVDRLEEELSKYHRRLASLPV